MLKAEACQKSRTLLESLSTNLAHHYERSCGGNRSKETVVLILGAGASFASQVPRWDLRFRRKFLSRIATLFQSNIFVQEAWLQLEHEIGAPKDKENLKESLINQATLEQISSVACQYPPADALIRSLFVELYTADGYWTAEDGPGPPPLLAYELIAHLVKHRFIDHIITFNFDELLDDALSNEMGTHGFTRIVSGHESITVHNKKLPTLIKLHGTVSSPDTMRFTYLDVSVLTRAMRKHLDKLFGEPAQKLRLISIGYSWRDRSFVDWARTRKSLLHSLTVIRKESRAQNRKGERRVTPALLSPLRNVKVISTDDLGKVTVENFCWILTQETLAKVGRRFPVQPEARHLLISKLFSGLWGAKDRESNALEVLRKRAQVEIILHLAKAKGMVNTASAPDLPRLQAYLGRLQERGGLTSTEFLEGLGLSEVMKRSPEPEAWDTYFTTATSAAEFRKCLAKVLVAELPIKRIEIPQWSSAGMVKSRSVPTSPFVEAQLGRILESSEIEVLTGLDHQSHWNFIGPKPLLSYGRFGCRVAEITKSEWTYLLVITESLRWMKYPWLHERLKNRTGKSAILAILPSQKGLSEWPFRKEFLSEDHASTSRCAVGRIPWWQHNRHMIVAIGLMEGKFFMKGVYFSRPFRSSGISPIALDNPRDCGKLIGIFLRYCRRLDWQETPGEFVRLLALLVNSLNDDPYFQVLGADFPRFFRTLTDRLATVQSANRGRSIGSGLSDARA